MAFKQTAAIARAKSWVGDSYPAGWCQKWVVTEVFASGGVGDYDGDRAADAEDGWKAAKKKVAVSSANAKSIPAGYPIYFLGGRSDHGHAAVSAGNGEMYSTDLHDGKTRYGRVGKTSIATAERAWGVKLAGYVITDGNGNTFTDPVKAPPVSKPAADIKPWFNVAFLNIAGNNKTLAVSTAKRANTFTDDITKGAPAVIGFAEVRSDQIGDLTKTMAGHGYKKAAHSHMLAVFVREHVVVRGSSFAKYKKQGKGSTEGMLRVKLTIDGSKCQVGVTHLDFPANSTSVRVAQMKDGIASLKRYGIVTLLPDWKSRTVILADINDTTGKVVAAANDAGFKDAGAGASIDKIFVGAKRKMRGASKVQTTSDHPIVKAKVGRA